MPQVYDYIEYYGGSGMSYFEELLSLISSFSSSLNINSQDIPVFNGILIKNIFTHSKWDFNVSGIGTDDTDFYLTLKNNKDDLDIDSLLQINKSGVTYISGVYSGQPSGQLTYSSGNNGTLNISVEAEVTKDIPERNYFWDIKNTGTNRQIRSYGNIKVELPVTKNFN